MRYTVFTCGVFYEHFGPGGLNALQISTFNNHHASIGQEGEFLVDFRAGRATIPVIPHSDEAAICMTSARDVARYIVATLQAYEELKIWPSELKFCTERFTMSELLALCSRVRGKSSRFLVFRVHKFGTLQIFTEASHPYTAIEHYRWRRPRDPLKIWIMARSSFEQFRHRTVWQIDSGPSRCRSLHIWRGP